MAYQRIVLSRQTNKKCIKGQAFWRRVGASLYETTLGLLLIFPGRVKSDRLDWKNAQKVSMVQWNWKLNKYWLEENFGLQGQQPVR